MESGMVEVDTVTLGGASPSGSLRGICKPARGGCKTPGDGGPAQEACGMGWD